MTTTTIEKKPTTSPTAVLPDRPAESASAPVPRKSGDRKRLLVGFDLGTNASCILVGTPDSKDIAISKVIPSIIGYAREGLVDGIIANNATTLIGDEALNHRLQLRMIAPLE